MQIGDLVKYESEDSHWGVGIIVGFIDDGLPSCERHYTWVKVHFGKWNCINPSPVNYLRRITK